MPSKCVNVNTQCMPTTLNCSEQDTIPDKVEQYLGLKQRVEPFDDFRTPNEPVHTIHVDNNLSNGCEKHNISHVRKVNTLVIFSRNGVLCTTRMYAHAQY